MAFSAPWTSMFPLARCGDAKATAPRLGINYVTASAKEATIGGITIRQDLRGLGIAGVVWNSARVLVDFLQQHPTRIEGLHVVELGAGTGAVGLVAALACSPRTLTMTDLREVVEHTTQRNLTAASKNHTALQEMAAEGRLVATDHCWGSTPPGAVVECDVVLCSDCLYEPSVFDKLAATLRAINPREVYLAYKQRHPERERAFFETVSAFFDITVWSTVRTGEHHEPTAFLDEAIFVCHLVSTKRGETCPEMDSQQRKEEGEQN